jgi:hypothetical protein
MHALSLHAQTSGSQTVYTSIYMCYIKYQYDANGNRTNRAYSCEWYNSSLQQNSIISPNQKYGYNSFLYK